jgi:glutamate-1-semialdehyde 2,1-aminomutase
MNHYPKSKAILKNNSRFLPGGLSSQNRAATPPLVFTSAHGQYMWDADGNRYCDYHAAFAAHFLGHNHPDVVAAVEKILREETSLYGSGTTTQEGELAELLCENLPFAERVAFLNSGSEATAQAIRLARAATGRDDIVVIQGGYNGWHNDVCCNVMTPLEELGPRISPGEYPFYSLSAGVPRAHRDLVHPVNFNDLASVEAVCRGRKVAAVILEPVLQNIGVVHPGPGYLEGLRALADQFGFMLIFDEVKTGFRHGLGGYAALSGVRPDLGVYGKAIANGFPLAVLAGGEDLMAYFNHPDEKKRTFLAGTYNAHPVPTAAAISTIRRLMANDGEVYRHVELLGARMEAGLTTIFRSHSLNWTVSRQGSAFCTYFMDHEPVDWHDLAGHHDFAADKALRMTIIELGVYPFPSAAKQWSISAAHTVEDVDHTIETLAAVLPAFIECQATQSGISQ